MRTARTSLFAAALLAGLASSHAADPPADGRQWVAFDSREKGPAAALVLTGADGKESALPAEADAGIIEYLADRTFGALPSLGLDLGDRCRVLLRFDLDRGRQFRRAELRLSMRLAEIPPQAPFEIAVHAVDARWEEPTVTWSRAPAFAAAPAAKAKVPADDGEVRIDVTAVAREWASGKRRNHGLLLRTAAKVPAGTGPPPRVDPGHRFLRSLMARWPWAESVEDALAKARAARRPVLAVVVATSQGEEEITLHDGILFSTALSHPRVSDLAAAHFVPVRVGVPAAQFVPGSGGPPEPLRKLGTSALDAGAPALVVARPDGKLVASLASIGTFDARRVGNFLREALASSGGERLPPEEGAAAAFDRAEATIAAGGGAPARADRAAALLRLGRLDEAAAALREVAPGAGIRASELHYWLGALLQRREDPDARAVLGRVAAGAADDPWTLKAGLRLAWPERVGAHEPLVDPEANLPVQGGDSAVVARAVDVLLRGQRTDGSWPVADPNGAEFASGVSVLAAHALLAWLDALDAPQRERADAALRRADAWLDDHVAKTGGDELNSFTAAYYLDYVLDRLAKKRARRSDVDTAVRQLSAGALPSGAWSYSVRFGRNWRGNERTHSVNTGLAVLALARAKGAGFAVDAKVWTRGVEALASMRKGAAAYTYMWPGQPSFQTDDASIARAPLCDLALLRAGSKPKPDLRRSLDTFMRLRPELRATGRTSTSYWLPPHAFTSYFIHFGYYHAAGALAELGGDAGKRDLALLRDDLLGAVEPDGAWVDDLNLGKSYGTAAALLTLRIASGAE